MKEVVLGSTGIQVVQNGFGALPIQRVSMEVAVNILERHMRVECVFLIPLVLIVTVKKKLGEALQVYPRESYFIATKTMATTPDEFWKQLQQSLTLLKTDYIDIYQFHCASQVYKPHDGTGMYECMLEAKKQGKIKHIGITAHQLQVALDAVDSKLYETIQFPFSYLSSDKELELVQKSQKAHMGFIAMKGLAGGLINQSKPAMAYMSQFDNVLPIWGIQKESELDEWLSYMQETPVFNDEMKEFIEKEKKNYLVISVEDVVLYALSSRDHD